MNENLSALSAQDIRGVSKYLEYYNLWRRGANVPSPFPKDLGDMIDLACDMLNSYEKIKSKEEQDESI